MANLLSNTTIGGYQSIHTGNIGSYAITSLSGYATQSYVTSQGYITNTNPYYYVNPGAGNGIGFWTQAPTTYGITMAHTSAGYGAIYDNSDYYLYFTITNGGNRGFIFRNDSGAIAQLASTGWLMTRGEIYPGYNNGGGAGQTSYYIYGNTNSGGIRTNGNWIVNGDIYLGTRDAWLSSWLNQDVRSSASPTFNNIYADGWFRNNNSYGLYNQAHGNHFYATSSDQWNIAANGSYPQIVFRSGGYQSTIRGYVYADTSNAIGFLNNAGNWSLRTDSSRNTILYGNLTVGQDASYSSIFMSDSDHGMREIHCNSNRIGFLTQGGSWGSWSYDDGSWATDVAMYSPIYYDSANTAYYVDPAGTSNIWRLYANDKYHYFGYSDNWDNGNLNGENSTITNVHFQGHPDFWIGAGNTKWYTSAASGHHDLLINTMQASGGNIRGITFTASTSGGSVYRLGRWFSHNTQIGSYLQVDGGIKVGGTTDNYNAPVAKLQVISSTSGSDVLAVDGVNGRLFTVTDDLSDSLFSVNTIAGLPVIEAFADNTVKIGKYGSNSITISNSKIAINSDSVDSNFPFYVGDRSTAGSRYSLTNPGMGFNLADSYAQLQLFGTSGAYIDFTTSSGQDSAGRIMWNGAGFIISGDTYLNNTLYTYTLYDRNDGNYYLDMNGTSRLGTVNVNQLSVYGNTYLGDGNGDEVHINDILRVGATDSGDAHFYFGEGGSAGSDYGSHWYWDSGYTFTWYTRNAGSDTALFNYVTNDTTYVNWSRNFNMQNREINYVSQLHFNGGTRFLNYSSNYLYFQTDSTSVGGIIVRDGNSSTRGYSGYFDGAGFGLLNSVGNWGVRLNPGNVGIELFYAGDWRLRTGSGGVGVNGNLYTDSSYGYGIVGLYSAERYQGVFAMGDSYKLSADGTSPGSLYGIAWTHTNVGGESKSGLGHQALFMTNGVTQTAIGTGIWTNGLITTTSYGTSANWKAAYDWGNHATAGYLTGAHNHDDRYYTESEIDSQISNRLYQARVNGLNVNAFNATGLYRGSTGDWSNRPTITDNSGALLTIDTHPGDYHTQLFFDSSGTRLYLRSAIAGSWGSWVTMWHSGNLTNLNQLSNGPGYVTSSALSSYVPLSGTTLTEGNYFYFRSNMGAYLGATNSPPLQVYATGGNAAFMSFHRGGNYAVNFGLDADNVMRIGGWSAAADRWVLDMSGNNTVAGSFRAPIFYDSNDTNYYLDPNSSSRVSRLWVDKLGGIGTYSWVNAAITTSSIEIVNQASENGSLPPTLAFHWYGDGGPQFRLASDTSNILYLESAAANSANTATNSTTYFNSLRLICQDATGLYVNGNGVWHRGDFSSTNVSNWNTAYGWGNHASAGYLTSGSLSGYIPYGNWSQSTGLNDNKLYLRTNGDNNHYLWNAADDWEELVYYTGTGFRIKGSTGNVSGYFTDNGITSVRHYVNTGAFMEGYGSYSSKLGRVAMISFDWNSNYDEPYNHGIMSTNANADFADSISINSFNDITLRLDANNNNVESYVRVMNNTQGANTIAYIGYNGSNVVSWFDGSLTANGYMSAPIYYDSDNGSYYGNFASTSVMNAIRFGTSSNNGTLSGAGDWGMRLTTNDGWIQFGPANSSHAHIYTNRPNFYFNADLLVNGNSVITSATIGSQSVSYASSAGSVAWTNVSSRPTALSQFTNDLGNYGGWLTTGGKAADSELFDGTDSIYFVKGNGVNTLGRRTTGLSGSSTQGLSSGFYDGSGMTNMPTSDWYHLIVNAHYNSATSNQYEFHIATAFWDKSNFYVRSISPGDVGPWRTLVHNGNIGSQSVNYANSAGSANTAGSATMASQLSKYGDIYGDNWNTYYVSGKLIASAVLGMTGPNKPPTSYDYGVALSYGETGGPLMQWYFPENSANGTTIFKKGVYRTGWNGNWSTWKTLVEQEGDLCTIVGGAGTGLEVHGNVGYNQNPLTYFLLRGQADTSWKSFKVRLTGDAGGQDIEFRRIAENGADERMFWVPRVANQVIFDYFFVQASDERKKDNITIISNPIEKVKQLRGAEFDWNSGVNEGTHDVGLIAQDVEAVLPEAVTTQEDGYKNLAYTKVIPLLVEAMKEQQATIENLLNRIKALEDK